MIIAPLVGLGGAAKSQEGPTQEVVVTGSRLPGIETVTVSPVTFIGATEIETEGAQRLEDVLNRLPQVIVDQDSHSNNPATGTATVNLRGLSAERTLVLIDGKRVMPGDPTSGEVAPDLNFIPALLVDHIEILTGGASAVYGSDAIAGVVNFVLKKDFNGVRLDAEASGYEHDNANRVAETDLLAAGSPLPAKTIFDGETYDLEMAAGTAFGDAKGHASIYAGYRSAVAVKEASRDVSACLLGVDDTCSNSTRSPQNGRFQVFDPATFDQVGDFTVDPSGAGTSFRPFNALRDGYNPASYQYFQRPETRYTAGGFVDYQLSPGLDLYGQAMFMQDDTTAQLAPSGLFGQLLTLSCTSPLLSAAEVEALCGSANASGGGQALVAIGRRDVEGGPRRYAYSHSDYRFLAGGRGDVGPWSYDVSIQTGAVQIAESITNDISLSRSADALDVVTGGDGQLVCASANPGCVPYDIFGVGRVTPAALAYVKAAASAAGATRETVASAHTTARLGEYGIRSPLADDAASAAIGAEFRRESLSFSPDAALASGDLAGEGMGSPAVSGHFQVYESYGELRLPVVQRPNLFMRYLGFEGGLRYSRYSNAGQAWTYKLGWEWSPTRDVAFRGGFNRAERAPDVVDLFTPTSVAPSGLITDPCAGSAPAEVLAYATAANCARTGVSASQYGQIAANPDGYRSLEGGDSRLKPETADSLTAGLVSTPRWLPGFQLDVDYFDIRIAGVITALGPDTIVQQCLTTGQSFLCDLIHRAPGSGSLWLGNGYVDDQLVNGAERRTRGIDFDATYQAALGKSVWGNLKVAFLGTYVASVDNQPLTGAATIDCAGLYGAQCQGPLPRWRHTLRLTWSPDWPFDASLAWRYVGAVKVEDLSANPLLNGSFAPPEGRLTSWSALDLSVSWRLDRRMTIRAGVNNLLDADPPINALSGANGNVTPGLYDALGRFLFLTLSASL